MKKILWIFTVILLLTSTSVYAMQVMRPSPSAPDGIKPMVESILGVIQFVGYAVAFSMFVYVGIKYTTSSADGKADVKKSSIHFLIGALIVVACTTLFPMIIRFMEKAKEGGQTDDAQYYTGYLNSQQFVL